MHRNYLSEVVHQIDEKWPIKAEKMPQIRDWLRNLVFKSLEGAPLNPQATPYYQKYATNSASITDNARPNRVSAKQQIKDQPRTTNPIRTNNDELKRQKLLGELRLIQLFSIGKNSKHFKRKIVTQFGKYTIPQDFQRIQLQTKHDKPITYQDRLEALLYQKSKKAWSQYKENKRIDGKITSQQEVANMSLDKSVIKNQIHEKIHDTDDNISAKSEDRKKKKRLTGQRISGRIKSIDKETEREPTERLTFSEVNEIDFVDDEGRPHDLFADDNDSIASDDDHLPTSQRRFTDTFDVLLHDQTFPEGHMLTRSRHELDHKFEAFKSKPERTSRPRLSKQKEPIIKYYADKDDVHSNKRASQESFTEWMDKYYGIKKNSTTMSQKSLGQKKSKSETSRISVISQKQSFGNFDLKERSSVQLSVVEPITYNLFPRNTLDSGPANWKLTQTTRNISKKHFESKIKPQPTAPANDTTPGSDDNSVSDALMRLAESQSYHSGIYDPTDNMSSKELEWIKSKWKLLMDKRKLAQAKIADLMEDVEIRDIKTKPPKRDFLKEAQTMLWLPRNPRKKPIEKIIKNKYPTRLVALPLPSDLPQMKPIVVRRYCLNKPKAAPVSISPKKDICSSCCMLDLGKIEPDTPLIREMKAKAQKMKLWTYYLKLKQRAMLQNRKKQFVNYGCGCVSSV